MRLLSLPIGRDARTARRSKKAFRPRLHPTLDDLEQRVVLTGGGGGAAEVASAVTSPISITAAQITNLSVQNANTLMATLSLSGTLNTSTSSTPFQLNNIQVPITLQSLGTNPSTGCPILHLSLQIPDLNILGLNVQLDNCNNGPVTVNVTAIPTGQTGGGVLGNLLCSLDSALSSGGLTGLSGSSGSQILSGLTSDLNMILTDLTSGSTGATAAASTTDTIPSGATDLVNLHLGPINLDVLGLDVTTSQICLNVYAQPSGGVLGGLLSSLDNLLSNGAASAAQIAHVTHISNILKGLNL